VFFLHLWTSGFFPFSLIGGWRCHRFQFSAADQKPQKENDFL
jgi:hypothetical protein